MGRLGRQKQAPPLVLAIAARIFEYPIRFGTMKLCRACLSGAEKSPDRLPSLSIKSPAGDLGHGVKIPPDYATVMAAILQQTGDIGNQPVATLGQRWGKWQRCPEPPDTSPYQQ